MQIANAVTIITGASSGIGRDLAVRMARRGATTILVARRADLLEEVRETCGRHAPSVAFPCDVRERTLVEEVVGRTLDRFGRVDILVNNAGYSRWTLARETPAEVYEDMMRTNYLGLVYATKAVLPGMIERGAGHIVNVSSIAGAVGVAYHTHYCATKFAVAGFTESLWHELRGTGVAVTLVKPGVVDTPLFAHPSFSEFPPSNRARMIPVGALSEALVGAIEARRAEVTFPRYFALGPFVRHAWPALFRWIVSGRPR